MSFCCPLLQDVLIGLVGIYNTTKTENVKATTASTISRLLRSSPTLLPVLLDRWGPQIILKGVCRAFVLQASLVHKPGLGREPVMVLLGCQSNACSSSAYG